MKMTLLYIMVVKNINGRFTVQHSQVTVIKDLCMVGWSLLPQELLGLRFVLFGFHVISCLKKEKFKEEKSFICQFIIMKKNYKARMVWKKEA